jgi:hypothetical protein
MTQIIRGVRVDRKILRMISIIVIVGIGAICFAEKSALADQASVEKVLKSMRSFRTEHGRAITDLDLETLATTPGIVLTLREGIILWKEMATLLKPNIKGEDLAKLTVSKRASIRDIRQSYKYHGEKLDASGRVVAYEDNRVTQILSGNKLLVDENRISKGFSGLSSCNSCLSYDGHVLRILDRKNKNRFHADIMQFGPREGYLLPQDALSAAMLVDSHAMSNPNTLIDLVEVLDPSGVQVLEDTETVRGIKCLVITDGTYRIYLDPSRDFSVVRFEVWGYENNSAEIKENDLYRKGEVKRRQDLQDLHDYGNGIWLPMTIEWVSYEHGKPVTRETTTVESIEINKGIDDKVFTDIIPKNTIVTDGIRNAVYRYGSEVSVEGMLSEVTQPKAKQKTWFLWLNIVALVVLVCIFLIRRWNKKRRLRS